MNEIFKTAIACSGAFILTLASATAVVGATSTEVAERTRIAASTMQDAIVVDCQLPGRVMMLGGAHQYLTPGSLQRLSAIDCRTRGGEYTLGDLASGTLSLKRWLPLAEGGNPEAQYYVARIYANGMSGVPIDYARAAEWYRKAAKNNYRPAMQELGYLYESGLGVTQDKLLALNLQREASGLGDALDYAWRLTAAKEDAAAQISALSEQLEAANSQLGDMRSQLASARDELARRRKRLAEAEARVLGLRAELKAAQSATSATDAAHVKELESALSAKESDLTNARLSADQLRSELALKESEVAAQLSQSQAASLQLNELLSTQKNESNSLRAKLAQSEQRLLHSEQELSDLRQEYQRDVERLTAQRDELDRAKAQAHNDDGAALLAAKEHALEVQTLRVNSLQEEITKLRQSQTDATQLARQSQQAASQNAALRADLQQAASQNAGLRANLQQAASQNAGLRANLQQATSQNAALEANIASLQKRYDEQVAQRNAAMEELASIRSKSEAERAALFAKASDQLSTLTAELTAKQRRIDSLDSESTMLKDELARLRAEQLQQAKESSGEVDRARVALQSAQQRLAEQRDELDRMRTDAAKERAALWADRDNLQRQMAEGQKANEENVLALKTEIDARQKIIDAKDQRIAVLEKKIKDQSEQPAMMAANFPMRTPSAAAPTSASSLNAGNFAVPAVKGVYYALIIGNTNYRYVNMLSTPSHDAKSVAELLEQRYAFKVNLMLDATSNEIMRALDNYTIELKDDDRLLIYYAGHGGSVEGPPERAFWWGVDADPRTQIGWISAEAVSDKIKQMRAKHILLVSDSCFSAAITHPNSTTIRRDINEKRFQIQWNRRARMVLTSGQEMPVPDISGDRNHSLFARFFLSVLRQNDGVMSGEMLAYELSSRMQPEAARMKLTQTPTYSSLQDSNHEYGDFFFLPSAPPVKLASLD